MNIRRVRKFIDFEVQASLIGRMFLHWVTFLVACGFLSLVWTRFVEAPTSSWDEVFRDWVTHFAPFAIIALSLLPIFLRDTIRLSHRFAGPMIRVKKTLAEIADGKEPNPVKFRKGDFWLSLQTELNRVLALQKSRSDGNANVS